MMKFKNCNEYSNSIKLTTLILFFSILGCKTSNNSDYNELYWKFHHTLQKVDTVSEEIEFIVSDRKVKKQEFDTLSVILNNWGWEYHLSFDSALFIRKYGNDIMNDMRVLDDELYRRMKDTINRTIKGHWGSAPN